jgi:hypothetical protein
MGPICDKKQARLGGKTGTEEAKSLFTRLSSSALFDMDRRGLAQIWLNTGCLADKFGSGKHER